MAARRTKTISKLTKTLLAEGEGERADFKRIPDGISADDLVSFANTDVGGSILAGIEEQSGSGGVQIGVVRGCDVTDSTILQITNKALSCVPPVAIEVYIENLGKTPFLRVDVSPSQTKPHCTPKGVYCRRDGSRNRPLHPGELLKMFLESESRAFAEKFEAAATRITNDLGELEDSLDRSIKSMADQLGWTDSKLGDSESTLYSILAYAHTLNEEANDISARLRALFRQDKREDPVRARARKELLDTVVKQLSEDPEIFKKIAAKVAAGGTVSMNMSGKAAVEFNKEDLGNILREAIKIVVERAKVKK
jgi:predicted HTH transcriptional regulator